MKFSNQEIEEILFTAAEMVSAYNKVSRMPSCINCKKAKCEYKPKNNGDLVRLNCPLWTAVEETENKAEEKEIGEGKDEQIHN